MTDEQNRRREYWRKVMEEERATTATVKTTESRRKEYWRKVMDEVKATESRRREYWRKVMEESEASVALAVEPLPSRLPKKCKPMIDMKEIRQHAAERAVEYRKTHKAEIRVRNQEYRAKNRERVDQVTRNWMERNAEKLRTQLQQRARDGWYRCEACQYNFATRASLNRHLRRITHSDDDKITTINKSACTKKQTDDDDRTVSPS